MKLIRFNKNLIFILTVLFFVSNIYFIIKADQLAKKIALLKTIITTLNKDVLESKPWESERNLENFIEGKKIPSSILNHPIYRELFSDRLMANKLSVLLVATSFDCGSCTKEEVELWKEFFNREGSNGIKIFSIYHNNSEESLNEFKEKYQNVFPVINDPDFLFMRELGIQRTPIIFILNNQNKIIYAHIPLRENKEKTENFIKKIERILQ